MGDTHDGGVIVTGAASGIGRETALALARRGAPVAVHDSDEAGGEVARMAEAEGGAAVFVRGDVTCEEDVRRVVEGTVAAFGAVDGLVNCAGRVTRQRLGELSLTDWNRTLAVNLTGPFLLCRECLEPMKQRRRGAIVNVASLAGQSGGILVSSAYSASKAGLIALTKVVAREGAPWNIRCNAIAPGPVATPVTDSWSAEERTRLAAAVPLGRLGRTEEIARVICFLLSSDASYLTGATIDVNGGLLMR